MRVLIITEAFGRNFFGVEQVLLDLIQFASDDIQYKVLAANIGEISNINTEIRKIPSDFLEKKFRWHPSMYSFFIQEMAEFNPDLVHVHGVFTFVQLTAVKAAKAKGIPVLLSVHGMLEPWTWRKTEKVYYLFKRLYWNSLFRPVLNKNVDYVHAITHLESKTLSIEFPNIPRLQIPNAIDLTKIPARPSCRPERSFVFLGRLHPKKGVDLFINAFHQAQLSSDWRVLIAGPYSNLEYTEQLHQLVARLKLEGRVEFLGPIYGDEKYTLFANAWVAVVPSYSEVIALVNLEAAASSTPTITTYATGLYDWNESGGILIEPKITVLANKLYEVSTWSLKERITRGEISRRFITERYNWNVVGKLWMSAYQKVVSIRKNNNEK